MKIFKSLILTIVAVLFLSSISFSATLVTIPDMSTGSSLTAAQFNQILDAIKDGTKDIKSGAILPGNYATSGLPTASNYTGYIATCTDCSSAGGMAIVQSDGTDWNVVGTFSESGDYTPTGTWDWSGVNAGSSWPTFNQNTTGTAAGLSGTPALPNGTTATTQSDSDNSTKLATTAYVDSMVSGVAGWDGTADKTLDDGVDASPIFKFQNEANQYINLQLAASGYFSIDNTNGTAIELYPGAGNDVSVIPATDGYGLKLYDVGADTSVKLYVPDGTNNLGILSDAIILDDGTYTFSFINGTLSGNLSWTLPTAAPGGANYLLNVDADGTMGYTDPTSLSVAASNVSFTPAGNISSTTVQAALQELDSDKPNTSDLVGSSSDTQLLYNSSGAVAGLSAWTVSGNTITMGSGAVLSGLGSLSLAAATSYKIGSNAWLDDTKGNGDTGYLWSADKIYDQLVLKQDKSGAPWQYSDSITDPTDADDLVTVARIANAVTVTDIYCQTDGSGSISLTLQYCDADGSSNCTEIEDAITCDADGAEDDGTLTNSALAAGKSLKVLFGAPSGTVDAVAWTAIGTQTW